MLLGDGSAYTAVQMAALTATTGTFTSGGAFSGGAVTMTRSSNTVLAVDRTGTTGTILSVTYGTERMSVDTTGSIVAGVAGAEHAFTGGDGGSGTVAFRVKNSSGTTQFYIRGDGAAVFVNSILGSNVYSGAGSDLGWIGRANMRSGADGVILMSNNAVTDFSRLQFGGTSSSFPALKRSSAALQVRLADDSAYAALRSLSLQTDAPAASSAGVWKLGVSTGATTTHNTTIIISIDGTNYGLLANV
jgi:hypothetical protein